MTNTNNKDKINEMLLNIFECYKLYNITPKYTLKSNLRYATYSNITLLQQNKDKDSIFAKLSKAGKEIIQVLINRTAQSDPTYVGVIIDKILYFYTSTVKDLFKISYKKLWECVSLYAQHEYMFQDNNSVFVTVTDDNNIPLFTIIIDKKEFKLFLLVSVSLIERCIQ